MIRIKFLILALFIGGFVSCDRTATPNINKSEHYEDQSDQHFGKEIGKVINDQFVITMDIEYVKTKFTEAINLNGENFNPINSAEIVQNEEGDYNMLGRSDGSTSAAVLILENGIFFEASFGGLMGTCTCTGCKSTGSDSRFECIAKSGDSYCYCTDCSKGDCTKTHSSGTESIW